MTRKYAAFSNEFKLEALRLAEDTELSIAQLSRNLGTEYVKVVVTFMRYAVARLCSKSALICFSGLSQTTLSLAQFLVFPFWVLFLCQFIDHVSFLQQLFICTGMPLFRCYKA